MRVLGFDPGTATTGYGVVEQRGSRLTHIAHGIISTPAGLAFEKRLRRIHEEAVGLIQTHAPDCVGIEKVYFKQNVTTGISVAQARGVLALAAAESGKPVGEFSPAEVKNAVVGYGSAAKHQIQEMVKSLLNLDAAPKPDDAADALALAICQLNLGMTGDLEARAVAGSG